MTRDLLRDHPEVISPPRSPPSPASIEFVLVDEFQDTDPIQGEILRLLERLGVPLGPAVRGRRRQAVDLPVPRRRAVDLPTIGGPSSPRRAGSA